MDRLPRIAAIVRSDMSGLGTLGRVLHECLGFHKMLGLAYVGERHDAAWYGVESCRAAARRSEISADDAAWLLDGVDVVLSVETWYGNTVPRLARERGVKTVLVPMHECLLVAAAWMPLMDVVICPHELCLREVEATDSFRWSKKLCLPMPIDTEGIAFRQRERALTFLHIGKSGDRDGTDKVLAAWRHVKSDARLVVRHLDWTPPRVDDSRVQFVESDREDYRAGYGLGDVLLHPHRYAGYGCVVHEALAAGLPVMLTAWWPFTDCDPAVLAGIFDRELRARYTADVPGFLPQSSKRLAIRPTWVGRQVVGRPILAFDVTPEAIAAAVDAIYGRNIEAESLQSRAWAEERACDKLRAALIEACG